MSLNQVFIITILHTTTILCNYLEVESSYKNPRLERNNIVNKGVWIRNFKDSDKTAGGNFLFRGNSIDVDNIIHGDFNAFSDNTVPNSPFISSYVERSKRSADHKRVRRYRKSLNNCEQNKNCNTNNILDENPSLVKSKLISKLKPASVFNDYPYEIAILLGNNKALDESKNYSSYVINEMIREDGQNLTVIPLTELSNITKKLETIAEETNKTNTTNIVPKRSMNNYESEVVKKIEITEDLNKTQGTTRSFIDRDMFAKKDEAWHQNAPVPDTHKYKVVNKPDDSKIIRPVTERGLIKVLSMLTNTFKKIMKQHSDIKDIHKKLHDMNEDFLKNVEMISDKFQDFETKYANLVSFNQKVTELDEKLTAREQHFKTKERELSKNLVEFEIQQKKFLTQQRQFYNIQKLMLAQNERINSKQNAIAKTQSEISHRQNNFARILKKAKQVYFDNKHSPTKTSPIPYAKSDYTATTRTEEFHKPEHHTSTMSPVSTDSVKINLFSIPSIPRIENQDHLLLNEKDEQPVDDLVYKYYFNNTFIDTLMKNFLSGFISTGEFNDNVRNYKNKRDEVTEGTTLLLPVNKAAEDDFGGKVVARERRWISHHSRKKYRRKNRGKGAAENTNTDDEKPLKNKKPIDNILFDPMPAKPVPNEVKTDRIDLHKSAAFLSMATGFCKGIGQNSSPQILDWCVEKALRRLQNIDIKMPPPTPPQPSEPKIDDKVYIPHRKPNAHKDIILSQDTASTVLPMSGSKPTTIEYSSPTTLNEATTSPIVFTYTPMSTVLAETTQNLNLFFPDNDKLESNLKQFDLKPDTEGNFYYDGSLHASDIIKDDHNSESDIMPGLDSNSRIDTMDPETFDTQAMRRAMLRRSFYSRMKYESMLKKMTKL